MDYVIAGNVMIDMVRFADGTTPSKKQIGGPSTFAYSGVKLFTDNVVQVSNVGEDYHQYFDSWIEHNKVVTDGLKVKCDYCNHSYLVYNEDGTYTSDETVERFRDDWFQDFGYMKTSPEEIGAFTQYGRTKGIYLAQNVDYVFWRKLGEIKERDGFQMMWEIESPSSYKRYMPAVLNALKTADALSINIQEARTLFEVESEEDCITELQKLPVAFTLFRVGKKGLYAVTPDAAYFLPSAPVDREVDPTGCGNSSTGGALYALCEGYGPLMAGIMANVAAAQNIRQFGVIPDFAAVRETALSQAKELYAQYAEQYDIN